LEFERGGGNAATGLAAGLAEVEGLIAALAQQSSESAVDQLLAQAAVLEMRISALQQMEDTVLAQLARNHNPGPASSLLKLLSSNTGQELAALRMEVITYYSLPNNNRLILRGEPGIGPAAAHTATAVYLNNRASTIFGGSNEVQKNIIAKSVLGL
jgi:alkylation response protein AidB-like acyl-CoA dehydrogenase